MATAAKPTKSTDLDQLCINTIRTLSLDAVAEGEFRPSGLPLGMAPSAYVLWTKFLRHNPKNPKWFNRDRFFAECGARVDVDLFAAAFDRIQPAAGRAEKFPAASFENSGTPGEYFDARRR
jgi:hypothetical protein